MPGVGRKVHRLGLCANMIDAAGFEHALDRGLGYVFWTSLRTGKQRPLFRRVLAARRDEIVVATGPSVAFLGGGVRRAAESILRELEIDTIDVFHLFWLGRTSAWTEGTTEALVRLKEEGKIRAIGISIHDRARAGRLASEALRPDLFMLRYNAAHPGCERDVFPNMELGAKKPAVVAYTATSWRRLLRAPSGWSGPPMTAGDCYRWCLSSPYVDVVLCGAKNVAEIDENLASVDRGPLTPDEDDWMRRFGVAVHG